MRYNKRPEPRGLNLTKPQVFAKNSRWPNCRPDKTRGFSGKRKPASGPVPPGQPDKTRGFSGKTKAPFRTTVIPPARNLTKPDIFRKKISPA
jgi:hypothetical protein